MIVDNRKESSMNKKLVTLHRFENTTVYIRSFEKFFILHLQVITTIDDDDDDMKNSKQKHV